MINLKSVYRSAMDNITFSTIYQNVLNSSIYPSKQWKKGSSTYNIPYGMVYQNVYMIQKRLKGMLYVAFS